MTETLDILFQDEHLVAINKPSGLLVHRSNIDRHETRFAVQILRDQLGQHVYPVHRLDKPTSGILLFALYPETAQLLGQLFNLHQLKKSYLAIVRGHCAGEGLIDHPLKEDADKYADNSDKAAQPASTLYKHLASIELPFCVDKYPSSRYSLVECKPLTGRKHQIRRHLKHINHPIIGDAKHGKGRHNRMFQERLGIHRLLLAATELEFTHPCTQQPLCLSAPLAPEFDQLLVQFNWQDAVPTRWRSHFPSTKLQRA